MNLKFNKNQGTKEITSGVKDPGVYLTTVSFTTRNSTNGNPMIVTEFKIVGDDSKYPACTHFNTFSEGTMSIENNPAINPLDFFAMMCRNNGVDIGDADFATVAELNTFLNEEFAGKEVPVLFVHRQYFNKNSELRTGLTLPVGRTSVFRPTMEELQEIFDALDPSKLLILAEAPTTKSTPTQEKTVTATNFAEEI